jgi:hypothetical protein
MFRFALAYLVLGPALARALVAGALIIGRPDPASLVAAAGVGLMYAAPLAWALCLAVQVPPDLDA